MLFMSYNNGVVITFSGELVFEYEDTFSNDDGGVWYELHHAHNKTTTSDINLVSCCWIMCHLRGEP